VNESAPSESWLTQMRKGLLELCILNLLQGEPLYGYEIVKRLTRVPELVISEGTIYPILSRLKKEKLLATSLKESDRGPVRKYYALTATGRKRMAELNARWGEIVKAMAQMMKKESV
jgi:PadR family transcriptional regulator PadR